MKLNTSHKILVVILAIATFILVLDPVVSAGFKKVTVVRLNHTTVPAPYARHAYFRAYLKEGGSFYVHPVDAQRSFNLPFGDGVEVCVKVVKKLVSRKTDLKLAKPKDCVRG